MKAKRPAPKITAVMLAKDVLKWLSPKTRGKVRIIPERGAGYVKLLRGDGKDSSCVLSYRGDLRNKLKEGVPCQVCGIGAFLVAKALREDTISVTGGGLYREYCVRHLRPQISSDALDFIEHAFESDPSYGSASRRGATATLKAICKQVIAGKIGCAP